MSPRNLNIQGVLLDELPHEHSEWKDLLREYFAQREDGVALIGRMVLDRGRPYIHFALPEGTPEDGVTEIVATIKLDCEGVLQRDRRSWTRSAWAAMEQRERIQVSLRETSTALATIEQVKQGLLTSGKVVDAASKIGQAVGAILRAWEWLA